MPLVIEAFRASAAAAVLDASVVIKRRKRGLAPATLVEGLFALWAAGGERCDDFRRAPGGPERGTATPFGSGPRSPYMPSDGVAANDRPAPPRYLTLRISKRQGRLFADGGEVEHFAIVTNRPDPDGGTGSA